ncbi:MAG: Allergen V5/Tpx related [Tardiphaga sp.]|nr:Allergen V5/Tpx related [Tardiphaga sp.]
MVGPRAWLLIGGLVGGWMMPGGVAAQTPSPPTTLAPPAALISKFRNENKQGSVTSDAKLTSIAQDQASAMAAKDKLDHDVLGPFGSRVASSGSDRAAENIAYGYDNFPKTLTQWINSPSHRKNLLLKDASRIGVASAKTPGGRTYWAMVIAGYNVAPKAAPAPRTAAKAATKTAASPRGAAATGDRKPACRINLLGLCL